MSPRTVTPTEHIKIITPNYFSPRTVVPTEHARARADGFWGLKPRAGQVGATKYVERRCTKIAREVRERVTSGLHSRFVWRHDAVLALSLWQEYGLVCDWWMYKKLSAFFFLLSFPPPSDRLDGLFCGAGPLSCWPWMPRSICLSCPTLSLHVHRIYRAAVAAS